MRKLLALALIATLALALVPTAAAHASMSSSDGKLKVVWGFVDEPAFTHVKNRLELSVRDAATDERITGLTSENLTVELHLGDREYALGNLTAYAGAKSGTFAGPGNYSSANQVYLTAPGIYVLHVQGNVLGSEIDLEIPHNHAVEPIDEIGFPTQESAEDGTLAERVAALEAEVAALKAGLATQATTPTSVAEQTSDVPGSGLMLAALAAVAAALLLRRRA